tara:strand:+ start:1071 stop:2012 length:942 start_codon:yes stop_codon:yes gene_type:complete
MGVAKALGKAAIEGGQQFFKRMAKAKTLPKLAPQITDTLSRHIDITKGADIPELETMLKGVTAGDESAIESFNGFTKTLLASDKYQANVAEQTRAVRGYTRPDAVENLRKLGGQTNFGKTQRTIQGPVPPQLADKTFDQGATTAEEAIMAGTTKFVKDGDPFQIRNYAAGYSPRGQTTKVGTRKTTGRGITKEGNTRKINEELATDPNITPEERKEFARIMAQAAAEGMDGDHIIEVSRVANAVRDMSPERRAAYFEVMRRTGTPTGNHPKNIQKLSKEMNQVVKPAEIRALDNALRNMDKRGKSLLEDLLGI